MVPDPMQHTADARTIMYRPHVLMKYFEQCYSKWLRKERYQTGMTWRETCSVPLKAPGKVEPILDVVGPDERIHFHSLRHKMGSWLLMEGVLMRVIQAIIGYGSVSVT